MRRVSSSHDLRCLRLALALARRGYGATSPNPVVGAVLVKGGKIIGSGWHRRAGGPHAEIAALRDAQKHRHHPGNSTLYVTLEPCSTHGRTPPCTDAIIAAGVKRVVIGVTDANPNHAGRAFKILRRAGVGVTILGKTRLGGHLSRRSQAKADLREALQEKRHRNGSRGRLPHRQLADECKRLNEAFNHWIVHRTPFVTVKAAMTLDGKIATATGESKWITGEKARAYAMKLRQGADAILVGINTVLADDPSLMARTKTADDRWRLAKPIRRIILDSQARTPLRAKVVCDEFAALTTIVVGKRAPKNRVAALRRQVNVIVAPSARSKFKIHNLKPDLDWLLKKLGSENITGLLVEGGGEVNASFLLGGFAHRVVFFYAPKILGGRDSRKAVAGEGAKSLVEALPLHEVEWKRTGEDLMMTARVA